MAAPAKPRRGVRWVLSPQPPPPPLPPPAAARRVSWTCRSPRHGSNMATGTFALRNRAAWLDHRNAAEDVSRWRTEGVPAAPAVLAFAAPYFSSMSTDVTLDADENEDFSDGTISESDSQRPAVVIATRQRFPMSSYAPRPAFGRSERVSSDSEVSETGSGTASSRTDSEEEVDGEEEEEVEEDEEEYDEEVEDEDEEIEEESSRSYSEISSVSEVSSDGGNESDDEEDDRDPGCRGWKPSSPSVVRLDLAQPSQRSAISAIALTPETERRRIARNFVDNSIEDGDEEEKRAIINAKNIR